MYRSILQPQGGPVKAQRKDPHAGRTLEKSSSARRSSLVPGNHLAQPLGVTCRRSKETCLPSLSSTTTPSRPLCTPEGRMNSTVLSVVGKIQPIR